MAKPKRKGSHLVPDANPVAAPQHGGDTTVASPDRERVAMRAYELYLARGRADGQAMDDWLTAERELYDAPERPRNTGEDS